MHQYKSLLNGKTDMHLLKTNQVSVSKKHGSTDAVVICMLLFRQDMSANTLVSGVRFPFGSCGPVAQ